MRIVRLLATATAAATLAILTTGAPALAHNSLVDASPAKNAILDTAPDEVKLSFLQRLDPEFFTVAVTDADKQAVPVSDPEVKGKVGTVEFTEPLANGEYTVAYRVVSQDGHPVQGSYKFTVDDPAGAVTPSAEPSVVPSPTDLSSSPPAVPNEAPDTVNTAGESDGPGWGLIIGIVAVVVLLGAGALVAIRRRKTS